MVSGPGPSLRISAVLGVAAFFMIHFTTAGKLACSLFKVFHLPWFWGLVKLLKLKNLKKEHNKANTYLGISVRI
jgi:hypothetical protein